MGNNIGGRQVKKFKGKPRGNQIEKYTKRNVSKENKNMQTKSLENNDRDGEKERKRE